MIMSLSGSPNQGGDHGVSRRLVSGDEIGRGLIW